jgi:hypothetical protein
MFSWHRLEFTGNLGSPDAETEGLRWHPSVNCVDAMRRIIYRVKPFVPERVWTKITSPYWWWYNRARHEVAAIFDHRLALSQRELSRFEDLHSGDRCFVLGNGPSLQHTNLDLIRNEFSFGMNRIYLHFPKMGFETTYFVSINTLVLEQCRDEISALRMPRFVTWRGRHWFNGDGIYFMDTDYTPPAEFSRDIRGRVFEGSTVTYVALQIAYFMGFKEVVLIGVDHSFSSTGRPNETVVSEGDDPNHFSTEYFGKGFKWQLPDLEASERAYRLAKTAFERDGRRIVDATIGGKLDVFEKVDYGSLF